MFSEIIHTALGGAVILKEKVETELGRLEEAGKLSKKEGEELLERLKTEGAAEEDRLKAKFKEALREVIDELGLATKEDIEKLKNS
ncbi:MAG: hypothetical protein JXK05_08125 [Campylobacterales bacterium]|nr:hypothetical protein [Campylobacterales bacterium]